MEDKELYRELCKNELDIPIFSRDWWLDAVVGKDQWGVSIVKRDDQIVASMPYYREKKIIFNLLKMPPLTQHMGIWIRYPDGQKYDRKLSYEKEVINEILEKLPEFDLFYQRFHYSLTNWLPFYWKGFKQTTRYTYVIENIVDYETVYNNFSQSKKKDIKKANKIVKVKYDLTAEEFYQNHKYTLGKNGQEIAYPFETFKRIYDAVYARNSGRVIYAVDKDGNLHSGLFVIWDEISAYNLISTIDPDHRHSGSASLLVYEMIKYLSGKTAKFDFEGSMIENVEASFKRFGTTQIPYLQITKTNSKLLMLRNFILEVMGR